MDCINCGNQLKDGDLYCNKCGNKVKSAQSNHSSFVGIYNRAMTISYGIAVLTCFICNLALEQTLSWFWIVLSAVALAYSVTNIPVIAGKHKSVAAGLCASVMVYVLLFTCNWFAQGDWLLSVAYPLATLSLLFAWVILLVCRSGRMNWILKSAFISLTVSIAMITINPLCNYLLGEPSRFYDYFNPVYWPPAIIGNKIAFICCLCYSLVAITLSAKLKYSERIQ